MNTQLFKRLWEERKPGQQLHEYFYFMRWLWHYFDTRKFSGPTVVEIGTRRGAQKKFYQQLLNARHIGIDISNKRSEPDILGNSHDEATLRKLKFLLGGKKADLIFIDGDHTLNGVRADYALYKNLAPVIAFHDIYCIRTGVDVFGFWSGLNRYKMEGCVFLEFFSPQPPDHYGIGVIVNEDF